MKNDHVQLRTKPATNPAMKPTGCNALKPKHYKLLLCAGNSSCVLAFEIATEEHEVVVLSLNFG